MGGQARRQRINARRQKKRQRKGRLQPDDLPPSPPYSYDDPSSSIDPSTLTRYRFFLFVLQAYVVLLKVATTTLLCELAKDQTEPKKKCGVCRRRSDCIRSRHTSSMGPSEAPFASHFQLWHSS